MKRLVCIIVLILALPARAAGCEGEDYAAALCNYREGRLEAAETVFTRIAAADAKSPETIRSRYFLVRIWMKQKKYEEAARQLVSIYVLSPAFYNEWSCDHLLGAVRAAQGKG
jgi:TolA-binding protein